MLEHTISRTESENPNRDQRQATDTTALDRHVGGQSEALPADPALVCGGGPLFVRGQLNRPAQHQGVTPDDEGSCRLSLCGHGEVTGGHNDVGGHVQILNTQEPHWASSNEAGYVVDVLDLIRHAGQGSPISRCVPQTGTFHELTSDVGQCDWSLV